MCINLLYIYKNIINYMPGMVFWISLDTREAFPGPNNLRFPHVPNIIY